MNRPVTLTVVASVSAILSVVVEVAMSVLSNQALQHVKELCAHTAFPSGVHWEKGFPVALPIAALLCAVAATSASIVAIRVSRSLLWRIILGVVLVISLLLLILGALVTYDFLAYPGGDASTLSAYPCGAG